MGRLFNRSANRHRVLQSGALCESLENRRLLSATGHSAGMKLHGVADLSIVQGLAENTINVATVTGPGTSAITPGKFSGYDNVGVRVDVRWGSGKSAVQQAGFFDSTPQPDVVNVFATNPLLAGVHPIRVTLFDNGKVVDVVKESIRVEAKSSNGMSLHAVAGKPFSAMLGYIKSGSAIDELVLSWGDQTQPELIAQPGLSDGDLLDINGTHTYARPGKYVITVTSQPSGPAEVALVITDEITSTITVTRR